MQINKRQLKKWIAALDSGKYKQTGFWLQDECGYCVQGVGCKVLIPQSRQGLVGGILRGSNVSDQKHAPQWLRRVNQDFDNRTGISLVELNDCHGFTFTEIATLLELVYIHKMLD